MTSASKDVLPDLALVTLHLDGVRQLAEQPSAYSDRAERACGGEDRPHVACRLNERACDLRELNDLVALADDGQVLASVATDQGLLVGNRGAERRDEDVPLHRLVEARGGDDLVVAGASGKSNAEPMPGDLADVDHLVDVVSHEASLWRSPSRSVSDGLLRDLGKNREPARSASL